MHCHGWQVVGLIGSLWLMDSPAIMARDQYLGEFRGLYEKKFVGNDDATKCAVCHAGPVKRSRNLYGKAVNKILTGRNVNDKTKIREALKDAEKEPSATPGKTFGDLIQAGVLPAAKN